MVVVVCHPSVFPAKQSSALALSCAPSGFVVAYSLQRVHLTEVGPRDGLQNEQQPVPLDIKLGLCERLLAAGVSNLEATSFVSPKWVPQMGDASIIFKELHERRRNGLYEKVTFSALTPNLKGKYVRRMSLTICPGPLQAFICDNDS